MFPLETTFAGKTQYNHLLPNTISQAYRKELRLFYQKYKDRLLQYDRNALTPQQRTSSDILLWECDINVEDLGFQTELTPINQFDCLPLVMGQLASGTSGQPFATVQDYDNWLKRVDGFVVWCDTAIANMRRGMAIGYVLPKALTEKMIPQMASFDHGPVEKHHYYSPVKLMPKDFPATERERLTAAYGKMVSEKIIPVYQRMHAFLKDEYLPASRASSGISEVPRGREYYAHQIKTYTTTTMSADEVFALGEKEVARLSSEMEKVKAQVGYTGDLKSFFDYVRKKKELMPFTKPEQVIDNFNQIHEKMKPQLAKLFDLTPKTPFQVKRTEAFREATASAEYVQGSLDGSRPGTFYVPIPNVREYNLYSDEDLFLHEAIPGHHYQVSLQQENAELPDFRRTLWYSAFGEGWALYCESLGPELGLYQDPYQYFGMLSAEMHRAIRLVVDAGMHAKGWTREQAIQYSLDHEAEPEASIIAEIERYMSWPGQALSYKVGQLKIRELRAKSEQKQGDKFDIKAFHRLMLEDGCLPLTILERKI
ncbi:MAG: DUF885 domain-containing protein [Saprospiraceae bacterium]|nr:DUF885 domain-containing protein [Saprospiraceae bacterium]